MSMASLNMLSSSKASSFRNARVTGRPPCAAFIRFRTSSSQNRQCVWPHCKVFRSPWTACEKWQTASRPRHNSLGLFWRLAGSSATRSATSTPLFLFPMVFPGAASCSRAGPKAGAACFVRYLTLRLPSSGTKLASSSCGASRRGMAAA